MTKKESAILFCSNNGFKILPFKLFCFPRPSVAAVNYQWHKQKSPTSPLTFIRPRFQKHTFISNGGRLYFSELASSDDNTYYCSVTLTSEGGTGTYIGSSKAEVRTSLGFRLHVTTGGECPCQLVKGVACSSSKRIKSGWLRFLKVFFFFAFFILFIYFVVVNLVILFCVQ
jgi:hypothetical protein